MKRPVRVSSIKLIIAREIISLLCESSIIYNSLRYAGVRGVFFAPSASLGSLMSVIRVLSARLGFDYIILNR